MRTNKKTYTELEKSVFVLGDFREREKNLLYLLWALQVRAFLLGSLSQSSLFYGAIYFGRPHVVQVLLRLFDCFL